MFQLEAFFDKNLRKILPALPKLVKDFLVMILPYLMLVYVIISIPWAIILFAITVINSLRFLSFREVIYKIIEVKFLTSILFLLFFIYIPLILEIKAIYPLFKRKRKGWRYLYYIVLIYIILSLIFFNFLDPSSILFNQIVVILILILVFYLLFQIKEYYN